MSLTASMWSSVSGLLAHGERMNVIGNNISNINTVGFKSSRMDFSDFMYQTVGTNAGMGQLGRGTSLGIIMNDFSQGSFETTNSTTDLAIGDNGFFMVKAKTSNNDTNYYTRAGNFHFDKDGFLVDPNGHVLQGWKVDNSARSLIATTGATSSTPSTIIGSGVPTDIRLDKFSCDPKHTNTTTLAVNLDSSSGNDKSHSTDNPFFSLLENWDATPNAKGEIVPLGSQAYAHPATIEVFDEGGQAHKLTIYFDRVTQTNDTNIEGLKDSEIIWEYIVTMEPGKDLRNFTDNALTPLDPKYKGLLMSGTLTFNSNGQLRDMTGYVPTSNDMDDLSTWVHAPISQNGFPMICPNFSGRENATNPWDSNTTPASLNKNADGYLIEMNLGLRNSSINWDTTMPATIADWSSLITTGGPETVYKVAKDANGDPIFHQKTTNAVAPADYPNGIGLPGLAVTQTWAAGVEGAGEATVGDLIFQQKTVQMGIKKAEADGGDGYVYEHKHDTVGGIPGLFYLDPGTSIEYILSDNDGLYYDNAGNPIAQPNPADLVKVADMTKKVATNTPVYSNYPKYLTDASGNPIQATTTSHSVGMGTNAELQNTASTSYKSDSGNNFYERFAAQDGYTYGELRYVKVSDSGVLSAAYSNGVSLELYQITLYDFPSKQNLRREGGNLFTETRESGLHTSGAATTGSFGAVKSNSLEQSNVDLSREFVNMITTQKGFQANSKSITTVDTMLDTVINMKR